jgi:hypothetical protein
MTRFTICKKIKNNNNKKKKRVVTANGIRTVKFYGMLGKAESGSLGLS